jgi:hypothetical protein
MERLELVDMLLATVDRCNEIIEQLVQQEQDRADRLEAPARLDAEFARVLWMIVGLRFIDVKMDLCRGVDIPDVLRRQSPDPAILLVSDRPTSKRTLCEDLKILFGDNLDD